tara:strand:+ start:3542 stop:3997 length:456 start_codon:yes stop_codon:yes gene_type:complete
MNNYNYGARSLAYLTNENLHPKIYKFMIDVLSESKHDISIIDGIRTEETQGNLFELGLTELDGINELSDHQIEKYPDNLGRAIDCIPYVNGFDIWSVESPIVSDIWAEFFRALLRVDRLWKQRGVDVGLELGWTYNIGGGRDYPHIGFKKL